MRKRVHGLILLPLLVSMLLIPSASASAAGPLVTDSSPTAEQLVNQLLGGGVTISNVSYNGSPLASGKFTGGTGIIGFESGIILSSGDISYVTGPNDSDELGADLGLPGDSDLDALIPQNTYDATVLEFDFVPESSTITFDYVFGSEEYNEYVNSSFNDVFGFFVNGVNRALLPDNITVVSINNVNGGNPYGVNPSNPQYYHNNDLSDEGGDIDTQLDGLTVVLSLTANVSKGATNHIKLAIADAGDHILDSDVFIKAGSFTAIPDLYLEPLTATNETDTDHTVTATAKLDGVPQEGITVYFEITDGPNAGLAGSGVTDSLGQASWTYTGGDSVGTDTIQATATIGHSLETSNEAYKTWELPPNTPPQANAGEDQTVEANTAGGAIVTLDGSASTDDGNLLPLTYSWSWQEDGEVKTATGLMPTVKLPMGTTEITLEVYDGQFSDTDDVTVTVEDSTAPGIEITCEQGTNPHGSVIPGKERGKSGKDKKNVNPDGFYNLTVTASDYSGVTIYIGTVDDPYLLEINNGEPMQIKFTESVDAIPEIKKIGSTNDNGRADAVEYHVILPSDPVITAVDGYGNATDPCASCLAPPEPM